MNENEINLSKIEDIHIQSMSTLTSPEKIQGELPLTKEQQKFIIQSRKEISDIIEGKDDRILIVVGPCSIHEIEAAKEYAERLKEIQKKYEEKFILCMRVYFEKPRTTVGWKGLVNDPLMDNSFDINKGLRIARKLLLHLATRKIPVATEFLDVFIPQYIGDLVSWGAIGARTSESQIHRQLASGLSMPVGFKNGTRGNIQVAIEACIVAKKPHHFLSVNKEGIACIASTTGNKSCHIILRGGESPNYDSKNIEAAKNLLKKAQLREEIMVDCSHANSNKSHEKQYEVAMNIGKQIKEGEKGIRGIMLESHLVEGSQELVNPATLRYGQSITDKCMSWEKTQHILETLGS